MNILLICLIITTTISIIWDYLQAPQEMANQIARLLTKGKISYVDLKKPFSCSLCMTFWITLIVLLICNPTMCFMSLCYALLTKYIIYIVELLDSLICHIFVLLEKLINKIKI